MPEVKPMPKGYWVRQFRIAATKLERDAGKLRKAAQAMEKEESKK